MSRRYPISIVAPIATTATWRWLVIPGRNPYIYVPAPTQELANSIAVQIDAGTCPPERFIHFAVTDGIRTALDLPRPLLPDLARLAGYEAWKPVSADTFAEAAEKGIEATAEVTVRRPGGDPVTLHLVAHRRANSTYVNTPAHQQNNRAARA